MTSSAQQMLTPTWATPYSSLSEHNADTALEARVYLNVQKELQGDLLDVGQLCAVCCTCCICGFVPPHSRQRLLCLLQHVQQL